MSLARKVVIGLLLIFLGQGMFLIRDTAPTADEVAFHMVNGYAYLKTGDFRMSPSIPALPRLWMALPWLALNPTLDLTNEAWKRADSVPFAMNFFYDLNRSRADILLYSSRFMILILGVLLGVIIYLWARDLYGAGAGCLSLLFYTFCPSFLSHSALGTTDVAAAFAATLAGYCLWRDLTRRTAMTYRLFILASAMMFAMKYNMLAFGFIFVVILGVYRGWKEFLKTAVVLAVAGFGCVWMSYGFEFKPILGGAVPRVAEKLTYVSQISQTLFPGNAGIENFLKETALNVSLPIPTYILGLFGIVRHHTETGGHYFFGQWTTQHHWYHYFVLFGLKMPIAFLLALGLRALYGVKRGAEDLKRTLPVLVPALFYFSLMMFETTANGLRYVFPAIPFLMVWAGALWNWLKKPVLTLLVLGVVVECTMAFPHYLSFFNGLIGGPSQGYRYFRDSDVDWGQGLKALGRYAREKNLNDIGLIYFGAADPSFYGLKGAPVQPQEMQNPGRRVYAVSLHRLEQVSWTDKHKPSATVGGSIFVYDLR